MEIVLVLLLLAAAAGAWWWYRNRPSGREGMLWRQCRQQLKMPPSEADQVIQRYIGRLEEKHPGKSRRWYLEKIIYDLERDRH